MKRKFYKELWRLRFTKMLGLEKRSAEEYEALLAECKKCHKDHAVIPVFEKLIADEKRHTRLVEDLLRILERQTNKTLKSDTEIERTV